jgi:hypothetical protein
MMTTVPQRTETERWRRGESLPAVFSRQVGLALLGLICLGITIAPSPWEARPRVSQSSSPRIRTGYALRAYSLPHKTSRLTTVS